MELASPDLTPSGVEPIDKLMGGLERGELYLADGTGSGKSLLGMLFLMEGLKRGESAALVTDHSPENAVRRFARLGYDCLEDIYSGRLIVLECGDDNVQQIAKMSDLGPVLKELRWLMGESTPNRAVFEAVGRLVAGELGDTASRTLQFGPWAKSLGSTTLLITDEQVENPELIHGLQPYVVETFLVDTQGQAENTTGSIRFEKDRSLPAVRVEVDHSQGIFLIDRDPVGGGPSPGRQNQQGKESVILQTPIISAPDQPAFGSIAHRENPFDDLLEELMADDFFARAAQVDDQKTQSAAGAQGQAFSAPSARRDQEQRSARGADQAPHPSSLDSPRVDDPPDWYDRPGASPPSSRSPRAMNENGDRRLRDLAMEELLRPPAEARREPIIPAQTVTAEQASAVIGVHQPQPAASQSTRFFLKSIPAPTSFNVLIITGDESSYQRIAKALKDFSLERAIDGVTGLAKLISFHPDLVVLDVDLQIIDGFKILEHIRRNLNVPIIVVSSSHLRASDRIHAVEKGADYHLNKPFSVTELRHKAKQLIARYRGIDEWITTGASPEAGTEIRPHSSNTRASDPGSKAGLTTKKRSVSSDLASEIAPEIPAEDTGSRPALLKQFVPYPEFVERVEDRVKRAIDDQGWFSIVGCRIPRLEATHAREKAPGLYGLISSLVRQDDVVSVNDSRDVLIMLTDADAAGANAFLSRLRARIVVELNQDPEIWLRQFPIPEYPGT
jgi:DNA-binding response OmpR family regulator/KaiC/GvpD/RAD55 family RecA-like ATPase